MFSTEPSPTTSTLLRRRALIATLAAVLSVGACFLIATATGADLEVAVAGRTSTAVPLGAALTATLLAALAAFLLAVVSRRTRRPRRTFLLITGTGVLLSVVPPVQAAVDAPTAAWLLVLHAVAALALIPLVASALPATRPAGAVPVPPPTGTASGTAPPTGSLR